MSTSEQPDRYALKKVGKFWLLGKPGKKDFKVCPLLAHAKEVNISENFLIADENVYEIKEVEHEELLLVKVEEIKVCDQETVKTQSNKPLFRYDQETNYDSGESLGKYKAEETNFDTAYDVIKVTGESELEQMHGKYSSLEETGQTEDTSLLDNKVTDELEQMHDEYSSLKEAGQTEDTSLIDTKEDLYQRGVEQTSLVKEAQAQDWSPPREFQQAENKYGPKKINRNSESKVERKFALPKGYTTEFIEMCCSGVIVGLKKYDCDILFTKHELIVKFTPEVLDVGTTKINNALKNMQKEYPSYDFDDITQAKFNQHDARKKVVEIEKSSKVKCSVSNNGTSVSFFGKILQDVKDANDKVVSLLLPPGCNSEQNSQKDTKDADSYQKTPGFSRQFSWSTRAKALYVFETKDKITVKVYSSDILFVPVDCIVNAANEDLKHGGGIARAIADAAGKDLNKEGRDYLKQHGKLRVGEVCHTGAGRMSYNYVIHAVGPCWSDYKPYSLSDVEKCETDLYNAVINSLSEAEKLMMETIAVSSISSGIYGCPLDLCSIQYAKAVVDYSRCSKSPLKEIHFVDTNMEMVQVMHETFQSMIPNERIPRSYDKMKYVQLGETYCRDRKLRPRNQNQIPGKNEGDDFHRFDKGHSGLVSYPYCHRDYPPGHTKKEFACCFGPGQNLYIYTADILCMTTKDMIACGNIPTGKTKGYLANAIKESGGKVYKAEMTKIFVPKPKEGDVVVCKSDLPNFKWVAHAIPHQKFHFSKDDREFKVTSSFHNIFLAMKSYNCHSIALPLIGTGEGNADPVFYGERFFEALCDFSYNNKEYIFKVYLVYYDKKSTDKAIETISKACLGTHQTQTITNFRAPKTGKTRWENESRPKSAGFSYFEEHRPTETGEERDKWPEGRTWSGTTFDSSDED